MKISLIMATLLLAILMTCTGNRRTGNPVADNSDPSITAGNYIISELFYEILTAGNGIDTLRLQTLVCNCIVDTLVTRVVTADHIFSRQSDTLSIELEQLHTFGIENTVSLFGIFHRVTQDTGLTGIWQLEYRYFTTTDTISAQDSLAIMKNNPAIGWLDIASEKLKIYYYEDSLPTFTTKFINKYNNVLRNYFIQVDSLSQKSLSLLGKASNDLVLVAQDSTGTISFTIDLSHPEDSLQYQPNPFRYSTNNPELNQNNTSPCQEYPDWINLFLNANALSE